MSLIGDWVYAIRSEVRNHKGKIVVAFATATFLILILGFLWPKKYESNALVFADEQNIIQPLLSGSAEVTKPEIDQAVIARDRIMSSQLLVQALIEAKLANANSQEGDLEPMIRAVRGGVMVTDAGRGHIRIGFHSASAAQSYRMASALTNVFIRDSSRAKRQESREAYDFIDNQVNTYREQLQAAEDRLKRFKENGGGKSADTPTRISQLRSAISAQTLDLQVARARREELQKQLSQEKQFINRQYKSDSFRERLTQAQSQLDTLRLSYNDTYPDIVSLKQQIQDLQKAITDIQNSPMQTQDQGTGGVNPVYAKLRGDLADAEINVRTLELKLASAQKLLEGEQGTAKQDAAYEAQLAELSRDYDVTKKMYESMLERKEKARLSVALDVQGQGVTYQIKEPPIYPTQPVGLRFIHFFLLSPVIGMIAPLALLVAYIQLDPRIRFVEKLQYSLPESIAVLAVVPHVDTPVERREHRHEWINLGIFVAVALVVYMAIGALRIAGVF